MRAVDYSTVASDYDRRYALQVYDGIDATVRGFIAGARVVAEVGCGTGHWLGSAASEGSHVLGIDRTWEMLQRARHAAPGATLIHGSAEQLPLIAGSVARLLCVNALHHFTDWVGFLREARRVVTLDGGVLVIGLDPHTALDRWWIYDVFPSARERDRARYPAAAAVRSALADNGFTDIDTRLAEHIVGALPFDQAVQQGFVERRATSQLMVIDDSEYARGLSRLQRERPVLSADLRLYATVGWRPAAGARSA